MKDEMKEAIDRALTTVEAAAAAVTRARDRIEAAQDPGSAYAAWRAMEAAMRAHVQAISAWLALVEAGVMAQAIAQAEIREQSEDEGDDR